MDSDLKVYLQPELAFCIWSNRYITDLVTMPSSVSPVRDTNMHCLIVIIITTITGIIITIIINALASLVIAARVHVGTTADLIGFQTHASASEMYEI